MRCESCGTENRAESRFCYHCGSPFSRSCPACGDPNRADARFCTGCGATLSEDAREPARPAAHAERRIVTVLFVDLVGYTSFAEGRDPERVRAVQQRYFDLATKVIVRHGGTVEKFIGDAVMAVWGSPVALEDDAERAVRAALEVVKAVDGLGHDLAARAGLVTGEAAVSIGAENQGMVTGDIVNSAARLQAIAEPGQALADRETVDAAGTAVAFEPVDEVTVKGRAQPISAWRPTHVRSTRAADSVAPPFVGRASELRRLKELLHGVGEDRRLRLASITGPAGIGKSRLAEELQAYADGLAETIFWHVGRSPSYGEGLAFWAIGEMVRRRTGLAEDDDEGTTRAKVSASLDDLVPDAGERAWIEPALLALLGIGDAAGSEPAFAAWRTFFERVADGGTVVLVFEDLQWADAGTIDFVEHLLDWSRSQPILVLTLARPELLEARPGWGAGRSNTTALALEPMPEADMRALLDALVPGLAEGQLTAILDRAGGMPLYAVEMVRALLAEGRLRRTDTAFEPVDDLGELPIPTTLRTLIASRLDALDPADRSLLQDASVLGLSFTVEALGSVAGGADGEQEPLLRGLVRRELLEIEADPRSPERGQYRFVQSLIREVAYETLSLRDRRARHLAAARHLEAAESEEAAGALASHYLAAFHASEEGPEADAVAAQARVSLRAAAERAASLGAFSQAVRNLEHAIELTADASGRYELLERATEFGRAAGAGEGVRCARRAFDAAQQLSDPGAVVRARVVLADALMDADEVVEAVGILEATVAEVDSSAEGIPEDAQALLWAVHARGEMRADRQESAIVSADRALVIAERETLEVITATALVNKGAAMSQAGRSREGIALLSGAGELAERIGARHLELRALSNLSRSQSEYDAPRALETLAAGLQLAERVGDQAGFTAMSTNYMYGGLQLGTAESWRGVLELCDRVEELTTERLTLAFLHSVRAWIAAARGLDTQPSMAVTERLFADPTDPQAAAVVPQLRAWSAMAAGDLVAALRHTVAACEIDVWSAVWRAEVAAIAGIRLRALDDLRRIADAADEVPIRTPYPTGRRSLLRGAVAYLEGRPDEALAAFEEALTVLRGVGVMIEVATATLAAAFAFGDDPRIRAWKHEARAILEDLDAAPLLARLDEALAAPASASPEGSDVGAAPVLESAAE